MIARIWNSPTATSWGSLAVRFLTLGIVLPLVLRRFDPAEVAVWLLFGVVLNLQLLGDLGFTQTYTRAVSYVFGGAALSELQAPSNSRSDRPLDRQALATLLGTANRMFYFAASVFFVLLVLGGSAALRNSMSQLADPFAGWQSWTVVAGATALALRTNFYTGYLLGSGQIALVRRWEIVFGLLGALSVAGALALQDDCTLLQVVVLQQVWVPVALVRNWVLFRRHVGSQAIPKMQFDRKLLVDMWPSTWRAGVGVLMSTGIIQSSGLVYAWLAPARDTAEYLLGLRIIQAISQVSQAPFYSKIPALNQLYVKGRISEQLALAKRGMRLSHWTFLAIFLVVGVTAWGFLDLVKSRAEFLPPPVWAVLGIAFFLERAGAMHLQLYSTTGHIIWHVLNGLTGLTMLGLGFVLYPVLGVIALPLAMAVSYGGIYYPLASRNASLSFRFRVLEFEKTTSAVPAACVAAYTVGAVVWQVLFSP
jgi:hypothetical protein